MRRITCTFFCFRKYFKTKKIYLLHTVIFSYSWLELRLTVACPLFFSLVRSSTQIPRYRLLKLLSCLMCPPDGQVLSVSHSHSLPSRSWHIRSHIYSHFYVYVADDSTRDGCKVEPFEELCPLSFFGQSGDILNLFSSPPPSERRTTV